jgi:Trypsin
VEQPVVRTAHDGGHPRVPSRWARASIVPTLLGCAITLLSGCWTPTQRAVIAVPAARTMGEGRPMRLLPPFELASAQDAVVRIVSDVTCTGTLIADDRVLTAHHCVAARDERGRVLDRNKEPDEIEIELGGDYLPWGEVKVRAIVAPDCGYSSGDGDIAILVLTRHLIGMPISVPRIESAPEPGDPIFLFGFGQCALTHDGVHRVLRDRDKWEPPGVKTVSSGHFDAIASVCPGDSGAPVYSLRRGDLIGVVSATVMHNDEHEQAQSIFTRVDQWPQIFSTAHEISLGASLSELPPYGDCHAPARPPAR